MNSFSSEVRPSIQEHGLALSRPSAVCTAAKLRLLMASQHPGRRSTHVEAYGHSLNSFCGPLFERARRATNTITPTPTLAAMLNRTSSISGITSQPFTEVKLRINFPDANRCFPNPHAIFGCAPFASHLSATPSKKTLLNTVQNLTTMCLYCGTAR